MAYRSSGADMFPVMFLCIWLPMMMVVLDDDPVDENKRLMDAMTATSVDHAIEHGMREELAPYFNACQLEAGVTPEMHDNGEYGEEKLAVAQDVLECLESSHAARQNQPRP